MIIGHRQANKNIQKLSFVEATCSQHVQFQHRAAQQVSCTNRGHIQKISNISQRFPPTNSTHDKYVLLFSPSFPPKQYMMVDSSGFSLTLSYYMSCQSQATHRSPLHRLLPGFSRPSNEAQFAPFEMQRAPEPEPARTVTGRSDR